MTKEQIFEPRRYHGVMISSTFTDLKEHRAALTKAIDGQGLKAVVMEYDTAKADLDVIDSSLQMVRDASAYIGLISHKYGQMPIDPRRNGDALSLTELEFKEAQDLDRPILLFIMGPDHDVKPANVETDPEKRRELSAFRERAKEMKPGSGVHRVYANFDSLEEFNGKAIHAVAGLRRYLDEKYAQRAAAQAAPDAAEPSTSDPIPAPPALYAEPPYIGSHEFVGRKAQLDVLSDWAVPADTHPVLLFDAIGGSGKSMLTWDWTTNHAAKVRANWAGRFWYSFYERGAVMADFCARALAYITREPFDSFRKLKTPELAERLLHQLRDRPWLFVLDGLERVLVAYNRFDAAEIPDEVANRPTDQIAHRDPCAAIRPEDDDLLRALAGAAPSKLLITSRLVPRVLLNPALQPIQGVRREALAGLRPADAEALLRSCGVRGDSQAIQDYLQRNCDCHPLVTGILGGLMASYVPDAGNFDAWVRDPRGGRQLDLGNLDLIQKRNHILKAALSALSAESRRIISIMALLSEAVDGATLSELNPDFSPAKLAEAVDNLKGRGLLQYEAHSKRYDLHPVVRSVAAGQLGAEEKDTWGQRAVDHFSARPHRPYEEAETLDDVRDGLHVVRTLLKMGRYQQACDAYQGSFSNALLFNLEAHAEILPLLRPFFPHGWADLPDSVSGQLGSYLANDAAIALNRTGDPAGSMAAYLRDYDSDWKRAGTSLRNIGIALTVQNRLAAQDRCNRYGLKAAVLTGDQEQTFEARLELFGDLAIIGQWVEAAALWDLIEPMGRSWSRAVYGSGYAEFCIAQFRFLRGDLEETHLVRAEELARTGKNRSVVRWLYALRGKWLLERRAWASACESLSEAVSMARAVGQIDADAETLMALAQFHLGQLDEPRHRAEQLASAKRIDNRTLADLWLAIGDHDRAEKHALAAYKWAWADGEPYVYRYELNKARAILENLGAEIPDLPPYDPAKIDKFPCEDEVAAAIEKLQAEKDAEERKP